MKSTLILAVAAAAALSATSALAGDAAAGKAKSTTCIACHGADGISAIPNYPNLKGQKEAYLVKQLTEFRDGKRSDPTMTAMAKPLSDEDIADLAAYNSSL